MIAGSATLNSGMRPTIEPLAVTTPVSFGAPLAVSMMKSVSATWVAPRVSLMPPECGTSPFALDASRRPPVMGKKPMRWYSVPGRFFDGAICSDVSAPMNSGRNSTSV